MRNLRRIDVLVPERLDVHPILRREPAETPAPSVASANHGGLDQKRLPFPRRSERPGENRAVRRERLVIMRILYIRLTPVTVSVIGNPGGPERFVSRRNPDGVARPTIGRRRHLAQR